MKNAKTEKYTKLTQHLSIKTSILKSTQEKNYDFLFQKVFNAEGHTSLCNWTQHIKSRDINIELPYIM